MIQPKPKKPVVKKTTTTPKKPKSVSERIGNLTLRDVKNAGEDALQLSTLGVYGKIKKSLGGEYKHKKIGEKKYGGKGKSKSGGMGGMLGGLLGGKNGKTVKKSKSGGSMKKCKYGCK
jgi:hypothetical protein